MSELSKQVTFISDPGHGWLMVPLDEIEVLKISDKISECSFVNGRSIYLEEDMDAGTYLNARRNQGHPDATIIEQYVRYFDRSQRRYQPPALSTPEKQ